jgi:leucyl aminopeptidase (aminopeptidase T)
MSLTRGAETAIHDCLALEPGETCLIVTDDKRREIGETLYEVAADVTKQAIIVQYPPAQQHGMEPPAPIAAAMRNADAFLAPTTASLSHTRARSEATNAGVRGATLPGITPQVFERGLAADYQDIRAECARLLDQLSDADVIRVTAANGTDITIEPGDQEWQEDTGEISTPGSFSNLPAGEVYVSPETATGTYVIDGTMMPHGLLDDDTTLRFTVEDGFVRTIEDPAIRDQVETAAEKVGEDAYNLAELGIGTNVGVTELVGSVLLDEKAAGTVHFAIGDDAGIGGDVDAPLHLDGIMRNPHVFVDGKELSLPG